MSVRRKTSSGVQREGMATCVAPRHPFSAYIGGGHQIYKFVFKDNYCWRGDPHQEIDPKHASKRLCTPLKPRGRQNKALQVHIIIVVSLAHCVISFNGRCFFRGTFISRLDNIAVTHLTLGSAIGVALSTSPPFTTASCSCCVYQTLVLRWFIHVPRKQQARNYILLLLFHIHFQA